MSWIKDLHDIWMSHKDRFKECPNKSICRFEILYKGSTVGSDLVDCRIPISAKCKECGIKSMDKYFEIMNKKKEIDEKHII